MGNSHSISLNSFQDQLISICLWKLRKKEIIAQYQSIRQPIQPIFNEEYEPEPCQLPFLYQRQKPFDSTIGRNSIISNHHAIIETNPNKLMSNMIDRYLNRILRDEDETNKLMVELITALNNREEINWDTDQN